MRFFRDLGNRIREQVGPIATGALGFALGRFTGQMPGTAALPRTGAIAPRPPASAIQQAAATQAAAEAGTIGGLAGFMEAKVGGIPMPIVVGGVILSILLFRK